MDSGEYIRPFRGRVVPEEGGGLREISRDELLAQQKIDLIKKLEGELTHGERKYMERKLQDLKIELGEEEPPKKRSIVS